MPGELYLRTARLLVSLQFHLAVLSQHERFTFTASKSRAATAQAYNVTQTWLFAGLHKMIYFWWFFFFNSDTVIAKKGPSTLLISDAGWISKRVWERWWWNKTLYCPRESNRGIAVTLSGLSRNELVWNFINKGTDRGPACSWVLHEKLRVTQLVM